MADRLDISMDDAALRRCRRVLIVGAPATGKTTLAIAVAAALGLPVWHMDALRFEARSARSRCGHCDIGDTVSALTAQHQWIIEGAVLPSARRHVDKADLFVLLALPWSIRMRNWFARILRYRSILRVPGRADGQRTVFTFKRLWNAWNWDRDHGARTRAIRSYAAKRGIAIVCRSHAEADALLARFSARSAGNDGHSA